jgi:Tfp pilus assembly protein PilX
MKKMLMPRQIQKKLDEQGFASIVIALILIIVLALFTVGFAQLARREQRNALDKQLATQAYFAAESGVNDTVQNLAALEAAPPDPENCLGSPTTVGPSENGVQYTCVLVNLKPPNLIYDNIQPEGTRYVVSSTSVPASTITVNWGSADNHNTFPSTDADGFLPAANWTAADRPAVLQFTITPLNDLSRAGLMSNSFTAYLYPTSTGGASVAYNAGGGGANGAVVSANCDIDRGKYPCQATITGVSGGNGPYLFRIIGHYDPSNVSINGKDAAGGSLGFDGQTQIDVTGKAHEVLKRIQVRVPRKTAFDLPKDAIDSGSTCKHFTTDPISNSQTVALSQDTNGACAPN